MDFTATAGLLSLRERLVAKLAKLQRDVMMRDIGVALDWCERGPLVAAVILSGAGDARSAREPTLAPSAASTRRRS